MLILLWIHIGRIEPVPLHQWKTHEKYQVQEMCQHPIVFNYQNNCNLKYNCDNMQIPNYDWSSLSLTERLNFPKIYTVQFPLIIENWFQIKKSGVGSI